MNEKKPINLYEQALKYGITHGLNEDDIDTHFLLTKLSQLKRKQIKTSSQSTRILKKSRFL